MNGPRRFSAAPVNFDRFVVLARSYSRSLSPDKELHQILRPFEDRTLTATETVKRQSSTSRVATPQSRHEEMVRSELIDNELAATQVLDRRPYSVNSKSVATTRSATVDEALFSTHAATSTSRSVSGGAAAPSSFISTDSSYSVQGGCLVGEETQDLGLTLHSTDEVDPLLHAVLQLGSPLYDPVKRQFVCWKLHVLEGRPRAAYGDVEGVSCDFCGHTDWLEAGDAHATTPPSPSRGGVRSNKGKADATALSASAPYLPQARLFYHCSSCQVDICRACVEEVLADERFHLPCLQCQRCGEFETRQNAPLHRCAEVRTPPHHNECENCDKLQQFWTPSDSDASSSRSPPTAPTLPPPRTPRASASLTCAGVPVGRPLRLGLSRSHQQVIKGESAPGAEISDNAENSVSTGLHRKRRRASPETIPTPRQCAKEEPRDIAETSSSGDVINHTHRQTKRVSTRPMRKPAPLIQKEESDSEGDSSRIPSGSTAFQFARYEVHLIPRTAEEAHEVGRIAREQHLVCSPPPSMGKASVFHFATRLAAETCIDRATVASLEAVLKRNLKPVCGK
ncbi:hypothetical protein JKF63_01939 [Porcisia hertigi]|uniref:Uncharacterized protein n=1 Tax=Porcisia hertigi TaxID=2761500 RepID=A0A836L0U7_9TRYP|nr:hypothetical protein JKF63_01939 [Porcisia hertigi]